MNSFHSLLAIEKIFFIIQAKILKVIDKHSNNPMRYGFLITENERNLLRKYMRNSKNYLEFGSGGSTFEALKTEIRKVISIEASRNWINDMKGYKFIRNNIKAGRLELKYIDIGPTKLWSMPIDGRHKAFWPRYSDIYEDFDSQGIDTVFIDGRFRVACSLKAIDKCHKDTTIIIHDFYVNESDTRYGHYNILLKYLTIIDRADSLGVFKIRSDINYDEMRSDYNVYKYDYE